VGALKQTENTGQADNPQSQGAQFGSAGQSFDKQSQDSRGPVAASVARGDGRGAGQGGYHAAQNDAQQARVVNGRAFYQNGGVWTDSTAQSQANIKQKQIAFNSDEYFELLKNQPQAAQWFALGNQLDIVLNDTLYVVR
jgi:hypothetical protein